MHTMFSICIPIYEFDVRNFVNSLHKQATHCNIKFEIRCYDDGSSDAMKSLNKEIVELPNVVYQEMNENLGRSAIRNKLAEEAVNTELLFLDCDSECVDDQFIKRYVQEHDAGTVTYGGRCYQTNPPEEKTKYFHWLYGTEREVTPYAQRHKHPYHSFMTNNFMISKYEFLTIKLDETLVGYGHEDTQFGRELKSKNIAIKHIDNPLCHVGLENADAFLEKTRQGLQNLHTLIKRNKIGDDVRLYAYYKKAKLFLLAKYLRRKFRKKEKELIESLCGDNPALKDFDFYKLGYLLCLDKKNS